MKYGKHTESRVCPLQKLLKMLHVMVISSFRWWHHRFSVHSSSSGPGNAVARVSRSFMVALLSRIKCVASCNVMNPGLFIMGGDLGGLGDASLNLRWGTAYASIPPIFREIVLEETWESTNWLKNGVKKKIFSEIEVFRQEKGHICYI